MDEFNDSFAEETQDEIVESTFQFFGTAREIVDSYTHCAICGANLHFTHMTDFTHNRTKETARCLECISAKPRLMSHQLH